MEDFVEERVSIREIRVDDTKAIQGIRIAISEEDAQVDFQKLVEQHISDGNGQTSLVAEVNGMVVGYMISTTLYAGFGIGKSVWIMSFGVHPEHMGQRIGLKLSNRICDIYKAKGVHSIYSSVMWDSIDVLSFFKKLGFKRSEFINLKKDL
jgi:predicted N-acetyltransferase YhbS